jgi:pilus assembly protein CpaB
VGFGAYSYLGGSESSDSGETVEVVVAARDIAIRSQIPSAAVALKELPASAVHPLALRSLDKAIERYALSGVRAGEQVLSADVGDQPSGGSLARLVPEGQRALSIAISDAVAAGGLVEPGDRIDIIGLFEEGDVGKTGAVQVAENIEVLAVSNALLGQETDGAERRSSSPTAVSSTVTIALTPEMAERVALADQVGSLRISLRRPGDSAQRTGSILEIQSLIGAVAQAATIAP